MRAQSVSQAEAGESDSIGRAKRAEPKVAASQIRHNVYFGAEPRQMKKAAVDAIPRELAIRRKP